MLLNGKIFIQYCFFMTILCFSEYRTIHYCGESFCKGNKQHTLCKFQSQEPASHCLEYERTIKTTKEQQAILEKLNNRRNKVASGDLRSLPSAANMMKLEWNEELAMSAQRWADQCVRHSVPDIRDKCRDLDSMYVGQNIATIYGEAPGVSDVGLIDIWYMELLNINASIVPKFRSSLDSGYSHYEYFTQLVWAKSKLVGCGGVKFKEILPGMENKRKRAIYRIICNFAPGGNILNETVYIEGPPCSKCPDETLCDSTFSALCRQEVTPKANNLSSKTFEATASFNINQMKVPNVSILTSDLELTTEEASAQQTAKTEDDVLKLFDYFSHLHEYNTPTLETTTKVTTTCKDVLVVDEFVELLKKKLSTDSLFKEFLQTSTAKSTIADNEYTDALALVSKIYSKKAPSTTQKPSEGGYLNSTLLVDLVEAVIFRNGDKMKTTQEIVSRTLPEPEVVPIKIQAELGEVRRNSDFNGHLFFPEDMDAGDMNTESVEQYVDATSGVLLDTEFESLIRTKATRDFLDDILYSDTITESTTKININLGAPDYVNLYKSGHNSMKKFLKEIEEKTESMKHPVIHKRAVDQFNLYDEANSKRQVIVKNYNIDEINDDISDEKLPLREKFKRNIERRGYYIMMYRDFLKKLASDLRPLRLHERFQCSRNYCYKSFGSTSLYFSFCLRHIYYQFYSIN